METTGLEPYTMGGVKIPYFMTSFKTPYFRAFYTVNLDSIVPISSKKSVKILLCMTRNMTRKCPGYSPGLFFIVCHHLFNLLLSILFFCSFSALSSSSSGVNRNTVLYSIFLSSTRNAARPLMSVNISLIS